MIITKYLRQHIYRDFALSLMCLLGVVVCSGFVMAIRELGDWLTLPLALRFVLGQAPSMISIVFPIAFFLGVSFGLNRLVRKFEMMALFSLSFHRGDLIRAILPLILFLFCVCSFISMVWKPIAQENFSEKMIAQQQDMFLRSIREGVISTQTVPMAGEIVVSSAKKDDMLYQSFISTNQSNGDLFIFADRIHQESGQLGHQKLMIDGMHVYRIDDQKQLSVQADQSSFIFHLPIQKKDSDVKTMSMIKLFSHVHHSDAIREIYRRIFPPLSLFFLAFFAVVSIQIHPFSQQSKVGFLYTGIALYYIGYLIVDRMMQTGLIGFFMMLIPHLMFTAFMIYMHRKGVL